MTYIGKLYIPIDNRFATNLTNPELGNAYLAGTINTEPKICIITSKPFKKLNSHGDEHTFVNVSHGECEHTFVNVSHGECEYCVMFHELGIITKDNTIEYMMSRHSQIQADMRMSIRNDYMTEMEMEMELYYMHNNDDDN